MKDRWSNQTLRPEPVMVVSTHTALVALEALSLVLLGGFSAALLGDLARRFGRLRRRLPE